MEILLQQYPKAEKHFPARRGNVRMTDQQGIRFATMINASV